MSTQKRGGGRSGKKTRETRKKGSLPAFDFSDDLIKGKKASAEPTSGEPDAEPQDPAAAKKISLPAYGFADDLLRELKKPGEEPADEEGGRRTAPGEGEDRIFVFADEIEADAGAEEPAAPVRRETWVSFGLAGETFALPVDPVHEVVRPSSITRVPHAPFPIRGVTNLRGRVVPVIDLRLRLELPAGEITRASRIVVVGSRGRRLGLLVDSVRQVVHLAADRIQPPPDDVMTVQSDYISGVYHLDETGEELILLLDVDRVLIVKEPAASETAAEGAQ